MCHKFVEHFFWIASSMVARASDDGMWDEEDGFFYDVLRLPDGARTAEGAVDGRPAPACARTTFGPELRESFPKLAPGRSSS